MKNRGIQSPVPPVAQAAQGFEFKDSDDYLLIKRAHLMVGGVAVETAAIQTKPASAG